MAVIHNDGSTILTLQIIHRFNSTTFSIYQNESVSFQQTYDYQGALFYVVFVVFLYGVCIVLLIPSSIRYKRHESAMQKYMRDIERVRKLAWRQEKFKTRLAIRRQSYHRILGCDRFEFVVDESSSEGPRKSNFPELDSQAGPRGSISSRRDSNISLPRSTSSIASDFNDDMDLIFKLKNESHPNPCVNLDNVFSTVQTIEWSGEQYEILSEHTVPLTHSHIRNYKPSNELKCLEGWIDKKKQDFDNRRKLEVLMEEEEEEEEEFTSRYREATWV